MNQVSRMDEKFDVRRQGRKLGPFDLSQIERMISRRQLGPKDEISPTGRGQWQRIDQWHRDQQAPENAGSAKEQGPSLDMSVNANTMATLPTSAIRPEPVARATGEWHVALDGKTLGPINEHTLGQWISEHRIDRQTLVWRNGMQDWMPAGEALPAALMSSPLTTQSFDIDNSRADVSYALKDLRSRRAFWVLIGCIIAYIVSAEAFTIGVFQVYTSVATRRFENSGLVAMSAIAAIIFAALLLLVAIELTKLRSAMSRGAESTDAITMAQHEHRVWLFIGLTAAFVILTQVVLAIYFLIAIARVT